MKAVAVFFQVLCYVVVTHAWTCTVPPQHYPAKQIDAGQGVVVMTDERNRAYVLSGSTWQNLGTVQLKHVSVGPAGIWGVDSSNAVYKYVSGDFVPSQGRSMQQVDAGGAGEVVGIALSSSNNSFCLASNDASAFSQNSFLNWASLSSRLMYISCGPLYGCWGTDSANLIYVTQPISPSTCEASGWSVVGGLANKVEVGTDGNVFVLNSRGSVYQRTGISSVTPQGTGWAQIQMCSTIKHVTYDLGQLWAITTGGVILKCSQ